MSPSRSTTRTRISLASGAGQRGSSVGLVGAILIHAAVIAATLFTWEHRLDIAQESPPVVPVDLVTIAQHTNIAPTVLKLEPKVLPEPPTPTPMPNLDIKPPQVAADESEAAPPDQAPSEPQVKPPPPVIVPKAKPQTRPVTKKNSFNLDSVSALLSKVAPPPASERSNARTAAQAHRGFGAQTAMTMDLVDALRNQIDRCWSPPVGAPDPMDLVVNFDLVLNPDGSVAQPPQLDASSASQAARNPFTHAAADAARRAIYACAPYKLPADRYAQWREIDPMTFDPRQMMGQ